MPTVDEHLDKAAHNLSFLSQLHALVDPYLDWFITIHFYTALHWVDTYLATIGMHPPTHHLRGSYVQRDHKLKRIYADYRYLEDLNRDARYTARPLNRQDVQDCGISLATIRSHLQTCLPGRAL